ncbi:MAG: CpsD/CapB family tyrosine-protein kinase [bacterium]|jgi:protein-tyrosine kinase
MSRVHQAMSILGAHPAQRLSAVGGASAGRAGYRVARAAPAASSPVFPYAGSDARAGEQYRLVRTRVLARHPRPRLMAVASANAGDGKTVTAINVAGVIALRGTDDVLLVGADLRHPDLTTHLGLPPEPGLAEVLAGKCELRDAIVQIEQLPRLHVLPAGCRTANVTELFEGAAWARACEEVKELFRLVVMDTAPVGVVADYELIQAQCDSVLLVVAMEHTRRKSLNAALASVPPGKLLGLVLNGVDEWLLWRTPDYNYRYGEQTQTRAAAGPRSLEQ